MKKYVKHVAKLSDEFTKGIYFVGYEAKPDFNDKSKINHEVTVLLMDFKENITIRLSEELPKDIKEFDMVDFLDPEIIFKGRGKGQMNGQFFGDLQVIVNASKIVLAKNAKAA